MSRGEKSVVLRVNRADSLCGVIKGSPSKSYTHRALLIAGLGRRAEVVNPLDCDDTNATVAMCRGIGADISKKGDCLIVKGCGGRPRVAGGRINVGESGTLLRFSLPILALARGRIIVQGRGTLTGRPNRQVVDVLKAWGVEIDGRGAEHCLPVRIDAAGSLGGGIAQVEAGVTSQVVSALLIAAPFAREDTILKLNGRLVSRPYVDVTMDVLRQAGVRVDRRGYGTFRVRHGQKLRSGVRFVVHGDYSSAAFPLVAGALVSSDVTVTDLVCDCQGDRRIVRILRAMGADITHSGGRVRIHGPARRLRGIEIDGSDIPDLAPILCVLGCFAEGTTRIRNVAHLVHKESNRLAKPAGELKKLGARIAFTKNELVIRHSHLHGGEVSACGDHRIAMALAVAGLRIPGGVVVRGAECISKSYPRFVADMKALGAPIERVNTESEL